MSSKTEDPDSRNFSQIANFALGSELNVPESAMQKAATLLVDTIGVAAGAADLEVAHIARDHAVGFQAAGDPAMSARVMFDGRRASLAGAAYAGATQIDNLDGHDGYNPTKGHIGCAVVPALMAFGELDRQLSGRDALAAMAMAYEFSARAAIALHATVSDYHTSGAWNALGVAALGCRLMNLDPEILRQAIGIAEYHGPRSQMMREIDNPTMLHDGSAMGAQVGVSSVFLAKAGFKGAPAITVEADEVRTHWQDLGKFWTIEHNYIKPYPICRWAHAAIDGVRKLMLEHKFQFEQVKAVNIKTFREASCLYPGMPDTTSKAQYSLAFSVATMLHHGKISPEHISGDALNDPAIARTISLIRITEDRKHSERFPMGRWSDVTIVLKDGSTFESGDVHARGGPEAPMDTAEIRAKFDAMCRSTLPTERSEKIWNAGFALLDGDAKFSDFAELVYPAFRKSAGKAA
jgi:2-methylcitrate dehydratase PrpD